MTTLELETQIIQIISDLTAIPTSDIQASDHLAVDLGMDSVTSMELIGMLDEELGIAVEMEETRDITTVREILNLAQRHLSDAA